VGGFVSEVVLERDLGYGIWDMIWGGGGQAAGV
jgi:hypothetical protein